MTKCTPASLSFHGLGRREITDRFDAQAIICDAGGLLLREIDQKFGVIQSFARGVKILGRP